MAKLTMTTEVRLSEIDNKTIDDPMATLRVMSHPRKSTEVILQIGNKSFTVEADLLIRAVANATNWP